MTLYVLCMRLMGRLNVTAVIAFLGRDTLGGRGSAKQLSGHLPALQIGAEWRMHVLVKLHAMGRSALCSVLMGVKNFEKACALKNCRGALSLCQVLGLFSRLKCGHCPSYMHTCSAYLLPAGCWVWCINGCMWCILWTRCKFVL